MYLGASHPGKTRITFSLYARAQVYGLLHGYLTALCARTLSLTHTHSLSLSLSLSHTHTHTHTHDARDVLWYIYYGA